MGANVAKLKLRYVNEYVDQTGALRRYFRRGGKNRGPLLGLPGSTEFMTAYAAYLSGRTVAPSAPAPHSDSFAKLATEYYQHPTFTQRKPNTRKLYRSILDSVVTEHGHRSVSLMTAEHAEKIIHKIGADRPAMANLTRAVMRRVMALAIKRKLRGDNPFAAVEAFEVGTHHTWTDDELRKFERRWALGTRERLAYALLLYSDQRVGDVVRMRRADISGGLIHVVQEKTSGKSKQTELWIPIHPELDRAMSAFPANGLTLVGDKNGRPIKAPALSRVIEKAARKAGLPKRCVPHGLRKALQRMLAEHGATDKEMQAMSGHTTLKETARYSKMADQKRLAVAAMKRLPNRIG